MRKFVKAAIAMGVLAASSLSLFGCSFGGDPEGGGSSVPQNLGTYTGVNDKLVNFSVSDGRELFRASNGYGNGGMFDCDWSAANVEHDSGNGALDLRLTNGGDKIYGAECQSYATYGYGYYSVRMKAIKREGVVSSFFTFTHFPNWDEIDIEILGKNTTKVQFNYFTNGVGKNEHTFDLGFDASEGFHEYGFKWEEDKITWYVDGKGVYCATKNIPSHPSRIMFNVWNGKSSGENSVKNWLGTFDKNNFPVPAAQYKWIGYKPLGSSENSEYTVTFHKGEGAFAAGENGVKQTTDGKVTPPTVTAPNGKRFTGWYDASTGGNKIDFATKTFTSNADLYAQYEVIQPTVPETGWVNISVNGFDGWNNYDVDKTNGLTVSHSTKPEDWATCGMDLGIKYTYVKFTVANSGTASANFRLDIKKDGQEKGAVAEVTPAANYNAYDRGAVVYGLAAGAHVDIVCKLDAGNSADKLCILLNSFGDNAAATGSVTITGLMGIPAGGSVTPDLGSYTGVNDKIADFTSGDCGASFEKANWSNGGMFDCTWSPDNIYHDTDTQSLHLSITNGDGGYKAGEYRTDRTYGYGYFAVCMKAVKKDGVVTSLFTYTGPSDGTEWHEIDIEILGNDTTKVQFNYYTNGVGNHEYLYDLGFDASEGFHEYGFKWEEGKIIWYVDGVGVYSATADIPSVPGKIMINAWPGKATGEGNVSEWSGVFDGVFPVQDAEYKWISYRGLVE